MLAQLGNLTLVFALLFAVLQIFFSTVGLYTKINFCQQLSKPFAIIQFLFMAASFFILISAFINNDFSLPYVSQHSNSHLPTIYKICAVWSAHAGSWLLWIFILSLWSAAVAIFSRHIPLEVVSRVLMVMGIISCAFYAFLFYHANPFIIQLPASLSGGDLNPILQDAGLAIHPPILYMGYVGFSVVFAFAITSLWCKEFNSQWAKWTKPWVLIEWCFLTLGIVLGSWWSYRELGWGGFWFWDPVENASLMPWLVGTALLHILTVVERNHHFQAWAVFLSLCVFALSLLGTFLVRSGILISVHTFSDDPTRGLFLLRVIIILIGCALLLFALRAKYFKSTEKINIKSRDSLILVNNILLFIAMLIILLGTLYPLIIEVLGLGKISVGAPYFNIVLLPIFILILFFIILTIKIKNKAMMVSHVGVLVLACGIIFSAVFSQEKQVVMKVGDRESIGQYHFTLKNISQLRASDYIAFQATVEIRKNNKVIGLVHPQLREFFESRVLLPKSDSHVGIFRDFLVALGMPDSKNEWIMRISVKPFIRWVWAGGVLMALGGLLALAGV